ncbi:Uncharacterized formyltransferase [hydrothermal vent metagenome]|uniref:Uncharacterized formyltransferase n=1 Tax=hydrothermal vent metagenome TaxID=652676 RepID=A0A3B0VWT5_9ZZZZ
MRFGFVTCVQLGFSCMQEIYNCGHHLNLAITLRDDKETNKSGRIYLDEFCQQKNIPLLKINHINEATVIDAIKKHQIECLFIIGWSQIAKAELLNVPHFGVLGMHPTLLPTGRGRAAIPWAILKRLKKTGVTLFKLDTGIDTGPIIDQHVIQLSNKTNASELYDSVNEAHVKLIKKVMPNLSNNHIHLYEQDESFATLWPGRKPKDGEINKNGSVNEAECLIRAVTKPYPGAFIIMNNKKIIIWSARVVDKLTDNLCLDFKDGYLECLDWQFTTVTQNNS